MSCAQKKHCEFNKGLQPAKSHACRKCMMVHHSFMGFPKVHGGSENHHFGSSYVEHWESVLDWLESPLIRVKSRPLLGSNDSIWWCSRVPPFPVVMHLHTFSPMLPEIYHHFVVFSCGDDMEKCAWYFSLQGIRTPESVTSGESWRQKVITG